MKNRRLKNTVLSALFLCIGLVLPFLTGQVKQIGNMLLPMHIPVLLCGLICGGQYGLIIGLILPVMRSAMFGMPMMYPNAVAMAFELATYGGVVGFLYNHSKWKCIKELYRSMIISMIAGRCVWGIVEVILLGIGENGFTFGAFVAGAITKSIPGIILQLIIIPVIMVALKRAKFIPMSGMGKSKEDVKTEQ